LALTDKPANIRHTRKGIWLPALTAASRTHHDVVTKLPTGGAQAGLHGGAADLSQKKSVPEPPALGRANAFTLGAKHPEGPYSLLEGADSCAAKSRLQAIVRQAPRRSFS